MNFLLRTVLGAFNVFHWKRYNTFYWNLRAKDIDEKWGQGTGDYETIAHAIQTTHAQRVLDIGCGSGRLFPLYNELKMQEVVAQDISQNAISLAKRRSEPLSNTNINFVCNQISQLDYPESFFDLVISNRTLSAVYPDEIPGTIRALCAMSKNIYVNEVSDKDYQQSPYFFKHDYEKYMRENNYQMAQHGEIAATNQQWCLFRKTPAI